MRCRFFSILSLFVTFSTSLLGQEQAPSAPPKDWFLKDFVTDNFPGMSIDKMFTLLKDRESKPVIVAVIDTGVDVDHEDLKNIIWVNEDEIANNGIDDDHNGYIDDIQGWNFIGDVNEDTYEVTRQYARLLKKFKTYDGKSKLPKKDRTEYAQFLNYKNQWEEKREEDEANLKMASRIYSNALYSIDTLKKYLGTDDITPDKIELLKSNDPNVVFAKGFMKSFYGMVGEGSLSESLAEIKDAYENYKLGYDYCSNPDFDSRHLVGDDYSNINEKYYGNNNVKPVTGAYGDHGTHVAGIIGADRSNNIGINGVADNVRIMAIRALPNGDERDKDIANAIYYAVDNGARIINLSAGKSISPNKDAVDKSVQYAETKGVLIIHASGNESANCDVETYYPSPVYNNGKVASNWINVGASSWGSEANFIGSFTNYGKKTVDVFAPGVAMYSTVLDNQYKNHDGTSMACPAVAGVAAVIMSYFPQLSAVDVKNIILQSVEKYNGTIVLKPGTKDEGILFEELSKTGGVVNGYNAVQMALKKAK